MDLQWKCRLIDRMISRNPNATIKDYFRIVDQEDFNQDQETKKIEIKCPKTQKSNGQMQHSILGLDVPKFQKDANSAMPKGIWTKEGNGLSGDHMEPGL